LKVAFLGDRLGLATGGNYYIARVAEELQKLGVEVTLITLVPPRDITWSPELRIISEDLDLTFGKRPQKGSLARFFKAKIGAITRLQGLIQEPYDILYSVGGPSNIVNHLCRKGPYGPRASVAIIHHLFRQTSYGRFILDGDVYRKPFQTFYHLWGDLLAKGFFIVTVSEYWKRKLISRGYLERKIRVIPNGADNREWPNLSSEEAKKLLGVSEYFVIYTNPLIIKKGILTLLEALKILRGQYPKLLILTTGRTDPETQLGVAQFLKENHLEGHFQYAGLVSRDQLPLYYLASDIVALLSQEEEGWGLTLLEGMISRKPVVCSPMGAMPELVKGIGLVLKENSVEEVVQGLRRLLESPELRNQMGAAGPPHAARFSYRAAAEAHLELFRDILLQS
jgi:glycosyltransferase involved in cell wall biosynthesis